ncbi:MULTISPECIES: hypothetical protein [Pseudomonas]|uniref:Uncharacterized protein n=1 Tax=Pseudomonas mosselii TaxID=78327 RepID=A0A5R8Z7H8_9PSED|nr:hypothetical protein [Pseudomonas mosselii]TLP61077.1 hypothetical protein FEM01_10795 [Pseudomonas mosselii]
MFNLMNYRAALHNAKRSQRISGETKMLFNPVAPTSRRLQPALFGMFLISCLAGSLAQAASPNTDAGLITLYGKKGDIEDPENDNYATCTIKVPPAGAGRSFDENLNNPSSSCYELRISTISMSNMPPATQILLTDDYFCNTALDDSYDVRRDPESNKNFWVKLRTGAAGATLEEESISALTFKGFASNASPSSGNISKDVQVEDFKISGSSDRMTYTLSCVRIISSTNKNTKRGEYLTPVVNSDWHEAVKESQSVDWTCPADSMISARKHEGDENGNTAYKCASLPGVKVLHAQWSAKFPECGINLKADYDEDKHSYKTCAEKKYDNANAQFLYFSCPADQVMTGRSHEGDENGDTRYQCAELYQGANEAKNRVTVWPASWSAPIKESNSEHACPAGQVMVGRAHKGDENNDTRYLCAKLRAPAN